MLLANNTIQNHNLNNTLSQDNSVNDKSLSNFSYDNVLGTSFDLSIIGPEFAAEQACEKALAEIDRLEQIYSRFDPNSELNQWLAQGATPTQVSADLGYLLELALKWITFTKGAFNPAIDVLTKLWQRSDEEQDQPSKAKLSCLSTLILQDPYSIDPETLIAEKHLPYDLNFNALAKGMIVDAAIKVASQSLELNQLLLNIGGDLRHVRLNDETKQDSEIGILVDIELNHKHSLTLQIDNQAVATSGGTERGFEIDGQWFSHVINPKTGWPVDDIVGVTVIAANCATADVLATAFCGLEPTQSLQIANQQNKVGCYIVSKTQGTFTNKFFDKHVTQERIDL